MLEVKNLHARIAEIDTEVMREVNQELPMEFAVEAQKLINISLEGSVG